MKVLKTSIISLAMVLLFALSPLADMGLVASAAGDASPNVVTGSGTTKTTTSETTDATSPSKKTVSKKVDFAKISASIKEHAKTNKDVKAWLTIPNTNMDMPIILGGKDNDDYANSEWTGKNHPNNNYKNFVETATYLDYRTQLATTWNKGSKNYVIYGHNWTNLRDPLDVGNVKRHTMFGQLPSYTSKDFLEKNPYIYFSTGENEGVWKVFSVAYIETDPKVFNHNTPNPSTTTYANILKEYQSRSMFTTDVEVGTNDKILTLSTCTRKYPSVYDAQRFVVVARLLRDGETENNPITVQKNDKVKNPSFTK